MRHITCGKIYCLIIIILVSFNFYGQNASNIYESYAILNINNSGNTYYDLNINTSNTDFDGANLGTFTPSNTLVLNGAQNQTYKCGTHNIMNGFIDYRIYLASNTPNAFIPSEILSNVDNGTSNYCSGTSLDQTWESSGANINVLNGLSSGDYILEVYTRAEVDWNSDNIADNTYYINNSGANYSATFRVDNPPTAICQDITIQLDAAGNASIIASDIDNNSSDDFGIVSLVASQTAFDCTNLGANNITLTVTDTYGQTDTCTAIVMVEDNINPTASCQDITIQLDVAGNASIVAADIDNGSSDNCGNVILSASQTSFDCTNLGANNVTLTVDDGNGQTDTCIAIVTVEDNINPTASCQDITIQLDAAGNASIVASDIDNGSSDNCGNVTLSASQTTFDCTNLGANNVTLTVDDGNGQTDTCIAIVTVEDNINPTASCQDITIQLDAAGNASIVAADIDNGSSDNCGNVTLSASQTTFDCTNLGTNNVTLTVDDGNGQTDTCTAIVTVEDNINPTASCQDITIQLDAAGNASIVAADIDNGSSDNCGNVTLSASQTTFDCTNLGTNNVTLTVDDGNGQTDTCIAIVTVEDNMNPTVSCPSDITTTNDTGLCSAVVTFATPTGSDTCSSVTITQIAGLPSGSVFPVGTTTNTFEAVDASGNSVTCSFDVIVNDNEAPSITCPTAVTVNADANCEVTSVNLGTPTTSDNCSISSVTNNLSSLLPLPVGTFTVTWTATDASGLTATCDQTVTVVDNTAPSIICPSDITIDTDAGLCTASSVNLGTPTTNDNCSVSFTNDAPAVFPVGTTIVTWTATDGYALTATCTQNVTVEDNENPSAICQNISIQLDPVLGTATISPNDINNNSTDNCTIDTLTLSQTNFDCNDIGDNSVTLTVTDAAGNSDTCIATVTITDAADNASVTISTPSNIVCANSNVTFTASPINGGTSPVYEWFVNNVSTGITTDTFTTNTLNDGDQVYVTMTSDLSSCAIAEQSNVITMTVNPNLPVSYILNASSNPACLGENLTFFVTGLTNGGSNPSYQWYINATPVGSNSNSYTTTTIVDGDVISVEVSSNATCANPVPATESLTMTVTPDATITLTTANDNQLICNNGSITNIVYAISNATNATVTGLPVGITGNYLGGNLTISGSTSQIGTFNYTVTSNGCGAATANGTITVAPDANITLASASTDISVCNDNTAMTPIQFQLNSGATGAILTSTPALPSGITGNYNSGTGIYTISGSSTQAGLYNYTVTTTGCGPGDSISGNIIVNNGIPTLPSSITGPSSFICPIAEATYSVPNDPNVDYYTWTVTGGFSIQTGQGTNEVILDVNGFALFETITVSATNSCGTSTSISRFVVFNFTSSDIDAGPDIYVCAGTTNVTMAGDDGGLDFDEWTWSDNGAGGSFSTGYVGEDCVTDPWWCWWCTPVCTDVYDVTETSVYTIPASAQPGDIITISLLADSFFWCNDLESTMQIHILENPEAEILSSDVTLCEGDSTTVTFSGTPNAQIRYNDGSGNTWVTLDASGNYSLSVSPTSTTTYSLNRVRYAPTTYPGGGNNCGVTINESVTVTLNQPATVNAGLDVTVCEDDTVDLSSASLGGSNAVGIWSTSGNGLFSGSTYILGSADIFTGTVTLTYTNTPSDGICPGVSDSMVVTIETLPTINTQPQNVNLCTGDDATFTVTASGDGLSYQWYNPSNNPIGGNTNTLTVTNVSTADIGNYYVVVSGTAICATTVTSNIATLSVENLSITTPPSNQTICLGDDATFTVTGTDISSYQWYFNGSPIPGAFGASYTVNNATLADAGNYSVVVSGTYCSDINSVNALLNITEPATATINYLEPAYCITDPLASVNLNGTNAYTGGTFTSTPAGLSLNASTGDIDPSTSTYGTYTVTYTTPSVGGCPAAIATTSVIINDSNAIANAGTVTPTADCEDVTVTLSANAITAFGATGTWTVTSGQIASTYSFSDINSPTSTFTGQSGETYTLEWSIDNVGTCGDSSDTVTFTFANCANNIDFDGANDYVNLGNNFDLSGDFSIEAWIKRENTLPTTQTIISKRNINNLITGYELSIHNNRVRFRWNGSGIITSSQTLNMSRWYHIALTYTSGTYRLYIDGILINSAGGVTPSSNAYDCLIGAMSTQTVNPTNHFDGWLDEIRLWNVGLSTQQIREMMNQEIEDNVGNVRGSVIPLDISGGLNWNNLNGYYQMNQGTDIVSGTLLPNGSAAVIGVLRNMTSLQSETAPLPYQTAQNGNWNSSNTWLNGADQMIPNSNGVNGNPINWNIVRTSHNISSGNRNISVSGLDVAANRFSVENSNPIDGQLLQVSKYLSIDGTLDLVGESQLIQDTGSVVNYSASGRLQRDQQGTTNLYGYNYWSSPVSSNGTSYNLSSTLYDTATGVNPLPLQWTNSNDANSSTTPITLSSRWLYLYENYIENSYASWNAINENSPIAVGLGYTMKGSGNTGLLQDYTFIGQPNNGTITSPVAGGHQALVGNPYPSALDAHAFINDNNSVLLDGTLYFWEHSPNNTSHVLSEYEGGYAYLNLTNGVAAVSPPEINGVGTANKIPRRFVPVTQGFFVTGNASGGIITFNNNQRAFVKESSGNSMFLRSGYSEIENTQNDYVDDNKYIRLDFVTPETATRHLLIGFMNDGVATDNIDYGYDGLNQDTFPNDMSFNIEGEKFVIQGVGNFDVSKSYPLDIDLTNGGTIEIKLADLENFDEEIDVFIYDALEGTYTQFNDMSFQMTLNAGHYSNRFFLTFEEDSTLSVIDNTFKDIVVNYLQSSDEIFIKTPSSIQLKQLYLINMAGQTVGSWNASNLPMSDEIKIPVKNISEGNYVIKGVTNTNTFNKKIIIKF
ncbi:HYR domain-containing protein [Psychroserpens sp. S379A]|uniref:HYR domain-containing protein n=1 Tax=Psychroserpens sp. S379A TaxID=3415137 RepID=UPI003C7D330E